MEKVEESEAGQVTGEEAASQGWERGSREHSGVEKESEARGGCQPLHQDGLHSFFHFHFHQPHLPLPQFHH